MGCTPQATRERIQMFAAASMTEAIWEIRDIFEEETGFSVELTLSSSSSLAVQIQSGAEADLFLPANLAWAEEVALNDRGRSRILKRVDLLSNRLAVVASTGSAIEVTDLADLGSAEYGEIAIAEPNSVPAGIYAREALQKVGLWEALQERLIPGTNVRTTLGYVATGVVPIGIVYSSDALASSGVHVLHEIDPELHSAIVYPLLLLRHSRRTPGAAELFDFLISPSTAAVFARHGFTPVQPTGER
jgi:molybdate transport system substrate-binding protein